MGEPVAHLECKELIDEYEKNHGGEEGSASGVEKKRTSEPVKKKAAEDKSKSGNASKKVDSRPKGFARGLTVEKIIGATNDPGELYFLIKWKGSDEADLVPAKEANVKIPQVVIKFYEERL